MANFGFLHKDSAKLTIEALYDKCDLILVPNEELSQWLIVNGSVNAEILKQLDIQRDEVIRKLKRFDSIGVHFKKAKEFWMSNNEVSSIWNITSNGISYEMRFISRYIKRGGKTLFNSIMLDKRLYKLSESASIPTYSSEFLGLGIAAFKIYNAYVGYYAINPYVFYEDSRTHGHISKGGIRTHKERDKRVIILTINHHKYKIRNGINVLDTDTGRIFPSIAEASRKLGYPYSMLWQLLKDNTIPPLMRIEKLHLQS